MNSIVQLEKMIWDHLVLHVELGKEPISNRIVEWDTPTQRELHFQPHYGSRIGIFYFF